MITVRIPVEDVTTVRLTYSSIRLYRDVVPDGAFSTLVATITLVAAQTIYSYDDAAGSANSVYQHEYYNAVGPAISARSPSYYAGGATLLRLRLEAAREAGAGFESTCSAIGTTTTLIDTVLADQGLDTAFLEGAYIYRPNAALAADRTRRVKKDGFTVAASSLAIDRAWANAPASGELYHIFNFFPPVDRPGSSYSWDRAVREGLSMVWFVDQVDLGVGGGILTRVSLATFPDIHPNTIRRVFFRRTLTNNYVYDLDMSTQGAAWRIVENAGVSTLETAYPARTDQTIIVEAIRRDFALYTDTDVTLAPWRQAVKAVTYAAYRQMNTLQPNKYSGEMTLAGVAWQREVAVEGPADIVIGV